MPNLTHPFVLTTDKWEIYRKHLKSLDPDSLTCRFSYHATEYMIDKMIDEWAAKDVDTIIAVKDIEGNIAGICHIAINNDEEAEIGLSIDKKYQRHGAGSDLLLFALRWCQNRNYNWVYMHCLSYNDKMVRLLHKHNIGIVREGPDSTAKISIPTPTSASVGAEWFDKQIGLVDRAFIRNQQIIDACKKMWT
jgi:RimJ/RimL family protein N-acetyltransferase